MEVEDIFGASDEEDAVMLHGESGGDGGEVDEEGNVKALIFDAKSKLLTAPKLLEILKVSVV